MARRDVFPVGYADARKVGCRPPGGNVRYSALEHRSVIGAVAGTVIAENVINFAHENGMYVIIQSARAVEILAQPEGFKAKEW